MGKSFQIKVTLNIILTKIFLETEISFALAESNIESFYIVLKLSRGPFTVIESNQSESCRTVLRACSHGWKMTKTDYS